MTFLDGVGCVQGSGTRDSMWGYIYTLYKCACAMDATFFVCPPCGAHSKKPCVGWRERWSISKTFSKWHPIHLLLSTFYVHYQDPLGQMLTPRCEALWKQSPRWAGLPERLINLCNTWSLWPIDPGRSRLPSICSHGRDQAAAKLVHYLIQRGPRERLQ